MVWDGPGAGRRGRVLRRRGPGGLSRQCPVSRRPASTVPDSRSPLASRVVTRHAADTGPDCDWGMRRRPARPRSAGARGANGRESRACRATRTRPRARPDDRAPRRARTPDRTARQPAHTTRASRTRPTPPSGSLPAPSGSLPAPRRRRTRTGTGRESGHAVAEHDTRDAGNGPGSLGRRRGPPPTAPRPHGVIEHGSPRAPRCCAREP